ncbi:MAG TPA: haloacid dehalogenase type II [Pseudonocardia sp.]|nr:haloacid dehalogenase type II [Pseudonocardia sp.]
MAASDHRPALVVVFDVNETLSDMAPMAARFAAVGAPEYLAKLWFASLLRDGFALTAAGAQERFSTLADGALRTVLAGVEMNRDADGAVDHILSGMRELPVHSDVPEGVRALRAAGLRLVTLSNGAASVADQLLSRAGLREEFEALLSVEQIGAWKPAPAPYAYAASTCGVDPGEMLLVAAHPWDIDGAARAGLATAWVNRSGTPYPAYSSPPTHTVAALDELPGALRR